jgi:hypothetical protein
MRKTTIALGVSTCLLLAPLGACSPAADLGEEDPLGEEIDDAKADSIGSPTLYGEIFFGTAVHGELVPGERYHAWTFALTDDATVDFETFRKDWVGEIETVLYLYRKTTAGRWRQVARADGGESQSSATFDDQELSEGTYRVIVKGLLRRSRGEFGLRATCTGDGCPGVGTRCEFGEKGVSDLPRSYIELAEEHQGGGPPALDPWHTQKAEQLTALIRQVSGRPELDHDQARELIRDLTERPVFDAIGKGYRLYQFVLRSTGKKVAGFYHFDPYTPTFTPAAIWHGKERLECTQRAPVCKFGSTAEELEQLTTSISESEATSKEQLGEIELGQLGVMGYLLVGEHRDALDMFEELGTMRIRQLTTADGTPYSSITFAMPESSGTPGDVSLIFEAQTTQPVAVVTPDGIERCTVYRDAPTPF